MLCLVGFNSTFAQTSFHDFSAGSLSGFSGRKLSDNINAGILSQTDSTYLQSEGGRFQRGYRGYVEAGFDLESKKTGSYNWVKVNIINSFQFDPTLTLGVGLGLRKCLKTDVVLVPVFLSLRSYFSNSSEINPFFSLQGGITLSSTAHLSDLGYFVSPQIGAKTSLSRKTGIYISVGMEMKNYTVRQKPYGYYSSSPTKVDMIHISALVGFEF